jgi:uncharacterized membrane protein YesL
MSNLFSYDNPIMQLLMKIGDLMILNVIYLACCLPIFTIGAASSALYDIARRVVEGTERKVASDYFASFRSNFKQATCIWLIMLAILGALFGCAVCYWSWDLPNKPICLLLLGIVAVARLCVYSWVFLLQAHFENSVKNTLRNGLVCALSFLPYTIPITFANAIFPFIVGYFGTVLLIVPFIFVLIWFSGIAYIITLLTRKPIKRLEEVAEEE